ncbi:MAG: Fe-S protein assembly co-chaperone HscB [Bacteroidota bacterium]
MNYFELFEIPVQLKVDRNSLPLRYFELSRKYHPDYFANEPQEAQAMALEKSALLNKAFNTFQNPDETIKYVLQLKGLLEEEEKYELPPGFLMEVLEINEAMMDGNESGGGRRKTGDNQIESTIDKLQSGIYEPVKKIVEHYKEGVTSKEELLQVKEYYYKKKYIDRIRQQLSA